MAIANKFLYFSTVAAYDAAKKANNIAPGSIVFVDQEAGENIEAQRFIETHGKQFHANQTADSIKKAIEALDVTNLTNSDSATRGVTITLNEVDGKVTSLAITDLGGAILGSYSKGNNKAAIAAGDTIAAALAKLENQISSVASDLSNEATARAEADTAIENKIGGSFTSESTVADAISTVDGKVDKEVLDRTAAINALDFTDTPAVKKIVTGVDETDGVISVTRKELKSTDKTVTITQGTTSDDIDFAVNIDGTTILKDATTGALSVASSALVQYVGDGKTIAVGAESDGEKEISATIKIAEVTTGLNANVEQAWDLVDATNTPITGSSRIIVKKDNSFVNGKIGHVDDTINATTGAITDGTGNAAIDLIYKNNEDKYVLITIDIEQYLKEAEFKDGLAVNNHEVSVKLSANTESAKYLKIQAIAGENGAIELSGIDAAIAAASSSIAAKTTGHVTVSSTNDANGTVYTISENDIASAQDLTNEIARAKNAETAIDAEIGLTKNASGEGREYSNTGNYIGKDATKNTIAKDIKALDTQAKVNADAAATAKTVVNAKIPSTGEHITVTVTKDSTDSHDIVTISENDIASAQLVGTIPADATATTVTGYAAEVASNEADAAEQAAKDYADDITVNSKGKGQDTQNILIDGSDIALTGYTAKSGAGNGDVAATDTVNDAIKKVETKVDNLDSASPFEYATGHESTKSTVLKGENLTAQNEGEVAIGKYNHSVTGDTTAAKTAFSVGNGTQSTPPSNAFEVRENGDVYVHLPIGNLGADVYSKLQEIIANEINWYEG